MKKSLLLVLLLLGTTALLHTQASTAKVSTAKVSEKSITKSAQAKSEKEGEKTTEKSPKISTTKEGKNTTEKSSRARTFVAKNSFRSASYQPAELPTFEQTRALLPQPIFEEDSIYVQMYWSTWEMAFKRFRQPYPGSPFISNYIDEAFNEALFLWDTAFMTMFCNYAYRYVPGIESLNNFYYAQMEDGEIVREVDEKTGLPRVEYAQPGTPNSLNHPILAWAELESFRITADTSRLERVFYPLAAYYYSYEKIKEPKSGLYLGSWASMDNSPRLDGMLCSIDTSSEVALLARHLAQMAHILGNRELERLFGQEAKQLSKRINRQLWNPDTQFYYDLNTQGEIHNVKTIAAFWPLLAQIPSQGQARALERALNDTAQFKRTHCVPTVPADQKGFDPKGSYWRGGVWTPTNVMVIEGLKRYHLESTARQIALNHLERVCAIYQKTGTVWEFYQPDFVEVGYYKGHTARAHFTGWTACVPIKLFIEYKIGIEIDAPNGVISWQLNSPERVGIEQLCWGENRIDLVAQKSDRAGKRTVEIEAEKGFTLQIIYQGKTYKRRVPAGVSTLEL